jgi:hypothetical protein
MLPQNGPQFSGPGPSVSLADLLLTKLQVFHITGKDLADALCLLADHGVADSDGEAEAISLPRLTSVLAADWGFCHTVEAIAAAPKSRAWKLRSRIGERIKWYETPEEVRH